MTMMTTMSTSIIMTMTITTMTRTGSTSTITTTTMHPAMTMSTSIITIMTASATTRSVPATITTTPTRYSPAGAPRHPRHLPRRTLTGSLRPWTAANTVLSCGPRASYPARAENGCTLTMCLRSTRCALARRTIPGGCALSAPIWTRGSLQSCSACKGEKIWTFLYISLPGFWMPARRIS